MMISYVIHALADEGGEYCGDLEKIARDFCDENFGAEIAHGDEMPASKITYIYHPCHRQPDGTYLIPEIEGTIHALAFGEGAGWMADMMINWSSVEEAKMRADFAGWQRPEGESLKIDERLAAQELLAEFGDEDVEYLVSIGTEDRGLIRANIIDGKLTLEWRAAQ